MLPSAETLFFAGTTEFDYKKLDDVRTYLRDFKESNLSTLEDHRSYIQLVAKFRELIEEVTRQNGDRFLEMIKQVFSVGDDGLYTNRLRFLFELIQNVDDCEYEPETQPRLTINFDVGNRKLVLRYNELGFTPRNVFSITGIAERAKNIDEEKLQIGEKGIGFKSVFGVANSVLVRSGLFSFRLNRDHFTIPIPEYSDGFDGVVGTELTLEFDSCEALSDVEASVMTCYQKDNALFTQNPIVFLNKLTGLEFLAGDDQLLSFSVTRPPAETVEGRPLTVRRGMMLALHRKGRPDSPIRGTCYATTVCYGEDDCRSRYGEDTRLGSREMKIEAFFPDSSYVVGAAGKGAIEQGLMYSFLPTQVELDVPVICHVPFKLDASREYVDSQFKNAWFRRTITALSAFIRSCYRLQACDVHESIIAYVPKWSRNFFAAKNNSKMDDLLRREYGLDGESIGCEEIFYCNDDKFHAAKEVVSFPRCEDVEQPLEVLRLCGNTEPFFDSPAGFSPCGYGMHYIDAPYDLLFSKVFNNEEVGLEDARKAVEIVKRKKPGLFQEECKEAKLRKLNKNHLIALSEEGELSSLIGTLVQRVRKGEPPNFTFLRSDEHRRRVSELIDEDEAVVYEDMGVNSSSYFKAVDGCCWVLNEAVGGGFCLPANNGCVIAGTDPAAGVIDLCRKLDPDNFFYVQLKLKRASAALDKAMSMDNPREFLGKLRSIRKTSKDAMGERAYKRYLDLIQKSGSKTERYINELLQNADDCKYPEDMIPSAEISVSGGELVFMTNEVGFKAKDVRAITAIGESTKNLLLGEDGDRLTIGEKGVGFKSIFVIADFVEVHSGGFDFKLEAEMPTVPCLMPDAGSQGGTIMRLKLKNGASIPAVNEQDVLDLCLCLRKLRRVNLCGCDVQIEDVDSSLRRVTINGAVHEFLVCEHGFRIRDASALKARNAGGKRFSPEQKIRCYVPKTICRYEYPLYCGLPTRAKTCVPIIVDAPFELTTARDAVLEESLWNEHVLENVYEGVVQTSVRVRGQLRINVLHLFGVESAETNDGVLSYKAKMFKGVGEKFLNSAASFIDRVRDLEIIPVKSRLDVFLCPKDERLRIFPEFLSKQYDDAGRDSPFERVDFSGGQQIKQRIRVVLEALTVRELKEDELWAVIEKLGDLSALMVLKDFRFGLYAFLRRLGKGGKVKSASFHQIVPVVMEDETKFVCKNEGDFFFSEGRRVSTEDYYIVDTEVLGRVAYKDIFGDELKEMNGAQERELYRNRVCKYLLAHACDAERYAFIMGELMGVNATIIQLELPMIRHCCTDLIPLKNLNGEFECWKKMFKEGQHKPLLQGRMLKSIIIDSECSRLAELLERPPLEEISYRDLPHEPWEFVREDVSDIEDGNIEDKENILRSAVRDGRIAEDIAVELGLAIELVSDIDGKFEFPTEPLKDPQGLKDHVNELLNRPIKIVSKDVSRAVDFCVTPEGTEYELDTRDVRKAALLRYSPGHADVCFCQMCCKEKHVSFVEVDCIERKPKLYFPELRLTLCLECSKRFKLLRSDSSFSEDFIRKLKNFAPENQEDNVHFRMPMPGNRIFELVFTRMHFAEIQEILKKRERFEKLASLPSHS